MLNKFKDDMKNNMNKLKKLWIKEIFCMLN